MAKSESTARVVSVGTLLCVFMRVLNVTFVPITGVFDFVAHLGKCSVVLSTRLASREVLRLC